MMERQLDEQKERFRASQVIIQPQYYPTEARESVRLLSDVEQKALDFFRPLSNNIVIVASPLLTGLNIPHFRQWYERTGKYFEAYIQHTRTGFLKNRPLSQASLKAARATTEQMLQAPGYVVTLLKEWDQLYFFGSLIMLDQLAKNTNFRLEIMPMTARDVVRETRMAERTLAEFDRIGNDDDSETPIETVDEAIAFLEELRQEQEQKYRLVAQEHRRQQAPFYTYVDSIIEESAKRLGQTRIFLPRELNHYYLDAAYLQGRLNTKNYLTSLPSGLLVDNERYRRTLKAISNFAIDPNAKVTQEDCNKTVLTQLLIQAFSATGIGSEDQVEKYVQDLNPDDIQNQLVTMLKSKGIEGTYHLLEQFDEKNDSRLLPIFQFMHERSPAKANKQESS